MACRVLNLDNDSMKAKCTTTVPMLQHLPITSFLSFFKKCLTQDSYLAKMTSAHGTFSLNYYMLLYKVKNYPAIS